MADGPSAIPAHRRRDRYRRPSQRRHPRARRHQVPGADDIAISKAVATVALDNLDPAHDLLPGLAARDPGDNSSGCWRGSMAPTMPAIRGLEWAITRGGRLRAARAGQAACQAQLPAAHRSLRFAESSAGGRSHQGGLATRQVGRRPTNRDCCGSAASRNPASAVSSGRR